MKGHLRHGIILHLTESFFCSRDCQNFEILTTVRHYFLYKRVNLKHVTEGSLLQQRTIKYYFSWQATSSLQMSTMNEYVTNHSFRRQCITTSLIDDDVTDGWWRHHSYSTELHVHVSGPVRWFGMKIQSGIFPSNVEFDFRSKNLF